MSKVLLIAPPYRCWGVQVIGTWPPLQLAYLAGVAEDAGHEVKLCDAMNNGFTFDDVRNEIEKTLRTQQQAQLQKQWIDGLKKKTFIRYF